MMNLKTEPKKNTRLKMEELLSHVENSSLKTNLPLIRVGDTIQVGVEIKEGEKTRTQAYEGVVISMKNSGINKTITVRKIMQGIGIERTFLINSPKIKNLQVKRSAKVRRAKLYYLRNLSGKATRLKQRFN